MLGASVILTELGEVMEILKKNLEINMKTISRFMETQSLSPDIRCEELFWGSNTY